MTGDAFRPSGVLPRLTAGQLRTALAAHGAAPRKRHGQHFLIDDNLLAAIVRDAGVEACDTVLEVGPGPGLLTRHLLGTGASVIAVEIDTRMELVARDLIEPQLAERLHWHHADALAGARACSPVMLESLRGSTRLVSNLPYNIAAPLLALALLTDGRGPRTLTVMVQREIAERLMARPGRRDWGPLAVIVALRAEARVTRRVPAAAFWPPPRVESAVLHLRRRERPQADPANLPGGAEALQSFLAGAFHARRKTLVNSLAGVARLRAAEVVSRLGGQENLGNRRAEAFDELELYDLAHRWAETAPGERNRPDS